LYDIYFNLFEDQLTGFKVETWVYTHRDFMVISYLLSFLKKGSGAEKSTQTLRLEAEV
jgi:hypothetical protein